ncbi:MAG: TIM barrel protein [Loktanella sp.]|nr:TIM barrel protein [Loktanella sp.]
MPFTLAACAEMLWQDKPMAWRCARLNEMGLQVGLWNWNAHDLDQLEQSGARFGIMNGYLQGRLSDDAGADMLLASAREAALVGKRLGVARLNLHGTGLGDGGRPLLAEVATPLKWVKARDTLHRICDMAEELDVVFTLENLNAPVDHAGVPYARADETLMLVAAVDRPQLQINLDLYHAQIGEGNLIELCRACLPWIGEIQVADVPGRFEPGTGEINFSGIARALTTMGYDGTVTMEAYASGEDELALAAFCAAFS